MCVRWRFLVLVWISLYSPLSQTCSIKGVQDVFKRRPEFRFSLRKVTFAIPSRQTISHVTFLGWREVTTGNPSVLAGYLRIALDWDRLWIIGQSLGAVYRWFAQMSQ